MGVLTVEPPLLHGTPTSGLVFTADFAGGGFTYQSAQVSVFDDLGGQALSLRIPVAGQQATVDIRNIIARWLDIADAATLTAFLNGQGTAASWGEGFVKYHVVITPYYLDSNGLLAADGSEAVTSATHYALPSPILDLTPWAVAPGVTPAALLPSPTSQDEPLWVRRGDGAAIAWWSSGDSDAARFRFHHYDGNVDECDVYVHQSTDYEPILIGVGIPNIEGGAWTRTPKSQSLGETMPGAGEMGSIRMVEVTLGRYDSGVIGEFIPTHEPVWVEYVKLDWPILFVRNDMGGVTPVAICAVSEERLTRQGEASFTIAGARAVAPATVTQRTIRVSIHGRTVTMARQHAGWMIDEQAGGIAPVIIELEEASSFLPNAITGRIIFKPQ